MEDDKKALPEPSELSAVEKETANDIVTLVDVDFSEYRRKNDMRAVKKNCTIPSWLNYRAEKAGVNFSAVLQSALKKELHLTEYSKKAILSWQCLSAQAQCLCGFLIFIS